jgi:hypothetical protein
MTRVAACPKPPSLVRAIGGDATGLPNRVIGEDAMAVLQSHDSTAVPGPLYCAGVMGRD